MLKTSFIVPLYNQKVTVVVTNNLVDVCGVYKFEDTDRDKLAGMDGAVFVADCGMVVALGSNVNYGLVAHECLHVTKKILGIVNVGNDEEAECYLLQWIVNKVLVWLQKNER